MTAHRPTDEQQAIIEAARTGNNLVLMAGAGTGKTSTLKFLAADRPNLRGLYIAYNKAIQVDAAATFPSNVTCKTSHGLAFAAVGTKYRTRLNAPRQRAQDTARILGINEPLRIDADKSPLAPQQLARLTMATIGKFCYSADEKIASRHVPQVNGVDTPAERQILTRYLVPLAQRAWDTDIRNAQQGRLPFTHDMYLKLWILTKPQLKFDFILLDEAQDSNPAVAALVQSQNAQQILVGDSSQAIYGWRGATDAMTNFEGERFYLSQSFRFGDAVAAEANKWLGLLDAPLRLRGFNQIRSVIDPELDTPDAILCRTNGGAMSRVMQSLADGRRVALVGGGKDIRSMAVAAYDLQNNRPTDHPELFAFGSWAEVQRYVQEDESASDLKVFVKLVDQYTPGRIIDACDRMVDERYADVVVSTAHKAKGREWNRVLIDYDFTEPKADEDGNVTLPKDLLMLAYVAVTRAKRVLNPGGLAWVDNHIAQPAEEPVEDAAQPVTPAAPAEAPTAATAGQEADQDAAEQEAWNELAAYIAVNLPEGTVFDPEPVAAEPAPAPVAAAPEPTPAKACPRCRLTTMCHCDPALVARFVALTGVPA